VVSEEKIPTKTDPEKISQVLETLNYYVYRTLASVAEK